MGSFIGHAIPGSFFMLAALWWIIRSLQRFYQSFGRNGESSFRCTVTSPPRIKRYPRLDVEALFVTSAGAIGIFVEIFAACVIKHLPIAIANMQHATMYAFFGSAGLICLFSPSLKRVLPEIENVKYCAMLLAYISEAILFKFHLFGRESIDVLVHTLLLYTVYGSIISVGLEMVLRDNVFCILARGLTTMVQGTWFWHVGFILYNPLPGAEEWPEDHHHMMLISLMFAWHIGLVTVLIIILAIAIASYYRARGEVTVPHFSMQQTAATSNGYSKLHTEYESESLVID